MNNKEYSIIYHMETISHHVDGPFPTLNEAIREYEDAECRYPSSRGTLVIEASGEVVWPKHPKHPRQPSMPEPEES